MVATIVLGVIIALVFALGLRHIYRNFFRGESTCCNAGGSCPHCSGGANGCR